MSNLKTCLAEKYMCIDIKAARAEAALLKRLLVLGEEKDSERMGEGLVQKDEAEKRRQELEKQRRTTFERHADDKDLNEELKAKELWSDPIFLW
jgi:pre-mRNA-splicing factor CWC26